MAFELTACPQCGDPAEVIDEGDVDSTDGQVPLVRIRCIRRHWFLMSADAMSPAPTPDPANRYSR